jgi:hypothetical protein
MSLKVKSVEAKMVLDLAALAVSTASKDGGMIVADAEALRLLHENPYCQTSFTELRDAIAMMAVKQGVGVEFGRCF